ncbi:MAG: class I SAM-dependent methyltransferase [Candidatus Aminicenantes bacterium]|nr:class I SAM-dependent methyltransferase [Candidatus Aminicenantes bacterium]
MMQEKTGDSLKSKDERRLYSDMAWIWPIVSPPEDYVEECGVYARLLHQHAHIPVRSLLHLGCGGGHHDHSLKSFFSLTGVDISPAMLALAQRINPEVSYEQGDMRSVQLDRLFDAVVLLDSVGYMKSEDELAAAFRTAHHHLRSGGVLLTVAEDRSDRFVQNGLGFSLHKQGEVEIVFIENTYDPDPADTVMEKTFLYIIRTKGALEVVTDRHECGLFPLRTWRRLLSESGFKVIEEEFRLSTPPDDHVYPLFIGLKRQMSFRQNIGLKKM